MTRQEDRYLSLLAVDQYMRQVRWTVRLSDVEVAQCFEQVQRGKQERGVSCPDGRVMQEARAARDRLVESFQFLVVYIAQQYVHRCQSMEFMDLVQEANLGLLEAIEHHETGKGYSFVSYAGHCIRSAVFQALINRDRAVRLPQRVQLRLSRMRQVERQLRLKLGRDPQFSEVAQAMGIEEARLRESVQAEEREVASLQGLLVEADMEDKYDFVSLFASTVAAEPAREESLRQAMQQALVSALPQRQREVIELRYGLGEESSRPHSQDEVAAVLGMFQTCVSRSEQRAMKRLRQVLMPGGVPQTGERTA